MAITVSSADVIMSANTCLKLEAEQLNMLASGGIYDIERLDARIKQLTDIVSSLAMARHGIVTRNPTFTLAEATNHVQAISRAIAVLTDDPNVHALVGR